MYISMAMIMKAAMSITGSIIVRRSRAIGTTAHSTPQWPTEPGSLCDRSRVSFSIMYMRKGTASDHIDDSIFAQSRW
jgi:hypothetical protein